MIKGNRILVVVDPMRRDEQACVMRGRWLAEKLGFGLELLICHYDQVISNAGLADTPALQSAIKSTLDRYRTELVKMARPLQENGMDVIVSAIWDSPQDEGIIRHALRTSPRIVIKETRFRRSKYRPLFSNTDWNLMRLCPAPLWLARPHPWPANATILASVDPTHEHDEYATLDDQILNPASLLSEKLGCELHAFHSYTPFTSDPLRGDSGDLSGGEPLKEITESRRERIDALLDGYPVTASNVHLKAGYPEELLPELARELDAGVVIMGSIARNPLKKIVIGSTTENVVDKLPCDLLVVKPEWFVSPVEAGPPKFFEGTPANQIFQPATEPNANGIADRPAI